MRRQVAISIVDQGLISAFNFGLNLLLIKVWNPQEYGSFGIIMAVGFLLTGIQNAMVNTPASVMLPTATPGLNKQQLRTLFAVVNLLICLLAFASSYLFCLVPGLGFQQQTITAIGLYLSSSLFREYLRNRAIVNRKLVMLLCDDGFFVYLAIVAILYTYYFVDPAMPNLAFCLTALAVVNLVVSLPALYGEIKAVLQSPWHCCKTLFPGVWEEASWSLVGVATTEAQNRGYIFVVGAFFGTSAVGVLQAGRVFFGPLNLITSAWGRVARPHLSVLAEQSNSGGFYRLLRISIFSFIVVNVIFSVALWLAWPYLNQHFFGEQYAGVELTVILWAVATLVFQIRSVSGIGVQACRLFKQLALTTVLGAVISMGVLAAVCLEGLSEWSVVSVIAGEVVASLSIFYILATAKLPKVIEVARGI